MLLELVVPLYRFACAKPKDLCVQVLFSTVPSGFPDGTVFLSAFTYLVVDYSFIGK